MALLFCTGRNTSDPNSHLPGCLKTAFLAIPELQTAMLHLKLSTNICTFLRTLKNCCNNSCLLTIQAGRSVLDLLDKIY
jgi:hypothetical protein